MVIRRVEFREKCDHSFSLLSFCPHCEREYLWNGTKNALSIAIPIWCLFGLFLIWLIGE